MHLKGTSCLQKNTVKIQFKSQHAKRFNSKIETSKV